MNKRIVGLSVFLLVLASGVIAQRERVVEDSERGFSFRIPAGFTSTKSDDGYVLNESTGNLSVLVVVHPYSDAEQFAEEVDLGEYGLALVGEPKQVNTTDYSFKAAGLTENGRISVDAFAMFSPNGGGLVVLAMATETKAGETLGNAKAVFDSVVFKKRKVSAIEIKATNLLKGKTLYKRIYRSGYSEEVRIDLCRDGTFAWRSSGNSNGAVIADSSSGRWRVVKSGADVYLVLAASKGKSFEYELDEDTSDLKVKLNGSSYFVRENGC